MSSNVETARESGAPRAKTLAKMTKQARDWRGPPLREQLQHRQVHITGAQEARSEKRAMHSNGRYIASSGHHCLTRDARYGSTLPYLTLRHRVDHCILSLATYMR
eukprot:4464011-Pyramimonas_sp.AAC.1